MVDFSILFSVAMALFLSVFTFGKQKIQFDNKSLIIWIWFYVVILVVSGFDYIIRRKKISGCVHALLMLGIGGLGFYSADFNHDLVGGGDNPAAGIYAMRFLVSLGFGVLAASCGTGVMWHVFDGKEKPKTPT